MTHPVQILREVLRHRPSEPVIASESYPISGVYGFGRGLLLRDRILGSDTKYGSLTRLSTGDVVYSKVKAFEGAVTVVPDEGDGRYVSPEFPVFAVDDSIDSGFLRHYLAWDGFLEKLRVGSSGIGARRERVHPSAFLALDMPVPDLAEQRHISEHLDSIGGVASTADAVTRRRRGDLAALSTQAWGGEEALIGDLVQPVVRARSTDPDSIYPMHGVRWYGGGLFTRDVKLGRELSAKVVYDIEPGDLVYNRLFAWKQSFAIAGPDVKGAVSNEFPAFRVNEDIVRPRVLLALLLGADFTRKVNDSSTGSTPTSRNRLKERDFLRLSVELPPMPRQRALEAMLSSIDQIGVPIDRADRLARGMLPAARNEVFSQMR